MAIGFRGRSLVVVSALIATVAANVPAAGAVVPPGPWHIASTLALGSRGVDVSCASPSVCWSLEGGQLLSSIDGGSDWLSHTADVPPGISALSALSCPTVSICLITAVANDGASVLRVDHGTLTAMTSPGAAGLPAISCPTNLHCVATDGSLLYATHDGGATWGSHPVPRAVSNPALTCTRQTNQCWLVGDRGETPVIDHTGNDGRSWEVQSPPSGIDGQYDVTCPTIDVCTAVGADFSGHSMIIRTTSGGAHWSIVADYPLLPALRSVSCPTSTQCWAASDSIQTGSILTTNDGVHWSAQSMPTEQLAHRLDLSCASITACVGVSGGIAFTTIDSGATWTPLPIPVAIGEPDSLSCPGAQTCVGVGNDAANRPQVITTADGGSIWTARAVPITTGNLRAVDCATVTDCVAIGTVVHTTAPYSTAQSITTTDGGATWTYGRFAGAAARGVLSQLSCPSALQCLAIGYDNHSAAKVVSTLNGGRTWVAVPAPGGAGYVDALSCAAVDSCVIVAHSGSDPAQAWTSSNQGATWNPHAMHSPDANFYSLSCAALTCVAVGSDFGDGAIATTADGGKTWVAAAVPRAAQLILHVTCSDALICTAAGEDFAPNGAQVVIGTRDGGTTWTSRALPDGVQTPIALDCWRSSCLASTETPAGNPVILAGRS